MLRREQSLRFREEQISVVNLRLLLRKFGFRRSDIEFVAFDQRRQLLRPFAIEFDPVPMRSDLVLQTLHFSARFVDLRINLLEPAASGRDFVFVFLDLAFGRALFFVEAHGRQARALQFSLQRFELLAGMMRIEHLQVSQQRLIAAGFPAWRWSEPIWRLTSLMMSPRRKRFASVASSLRRASRF